MRPSSTARAGTRRGAPKTGVPRDESGARLPGLDVTPATIDLLAERIVEFKALLLRPTGQAAPVQARVMKTFSARPADVTCDWFVVDATDKVLGRLAAEVAARLRGKHKVIYTPHVDTGDFIVVTNVEKIRVTGNKAEAKLYHRHSGYPGGITTTNFKKLQARFPGRVLEKAVKGMLPKGPLGYAMLKKLKCYAGPSHPHSAQQPKALDL